jgi:CRP-like cAMP-binding protein
MRVTTPVDLDPKEYGQTLEFLKQIDFLKGVPDDNLKSMLFSLQKQDFAAGKIILRQGEIGTNLYMIRRGKVIITTKARANRIHLAELHPPLYFGEISLLRPTSATATVTAGDEGAEVLILSNESVSQLSRKFSDIQVRIQSVIEARISAKQQAKDADENAEN